MTVRKSIGITCRALALFWTLIAGHPAARADATLTEKAAAEALFRQGAELLSEGSTEQACAKFEASQQLDSALGTTLRLADCYDRLGRTASAWALFQEAAAAARAQQQPEREAIARERAKALQARLSYLQINLSDKARLLKGLEVRLNGTAIPPGSWGAPMPVDPGEQQVKVAAPGHVSWETELTLSEESDERVVEVPPLASAGPPAADPEAESPGPAGGLGTEDATKGADYAADEPAYSSKPASTQRTLGYIGVGVGVLSLGAAGYFTYRAYDLNAQSMDHCLAVETTACAPEGKTLRDDARSAGTLATITSAAGVVLLGGAIITLYTAPSDEARVKPGLTKVAARTTSTSAALELGGVW